MAPEVINPKTINRSQTAIPVSLTADSAKLLDTTGKLVDDDENALALAILFLNEPCPAHFGCSWSGRSGRLRRSSPATAINIAPVVPAPLPRRWSLLLRASPARWRRGHIDRQRHQFLQLPATGNPLPPDLAGEITFICITSCHMQNPREPAKLVGEMVRAEMERRAGRGSFTIKIDGVMARR